MLIVRGFQFSFYSTLRINYFVPILQPLLWWWGGTCWLGQKLSLWMGLISKSCGIQGRWQTVVVKSHQHWGQRDWETTETLWDWGPTQDQDYIRQRKEQNRKKKTASFFFFQIEQQHPWKQTFHHILFILGLCLFGFFFLETIKKKQRRRLRSMKLIDHVYNPKKRPRQ